VVAVVAVLTLHWIHIDLLRRRVSELEQTCQLMMSATDKHLLATLQHQPSSLADKRRFSTEV